MEGHAMANHHYHSSGREDKRKSSQDDSSTIHQDCHDIVEMETILVEDLIKPVIFFQNYTLPTYNTIKFDAGTRCCVVVKGHLFRMVILYFKL